ncbi:hypothetical protein [Desulfosporosinus sp. SB140]|uniref:hypothetical protein n=1 Tax=Desulfosporosinus paludis TaxID=3115649 RepID=UPI00388D4B52
MINQFRISMKSWLKLILVAFILVTSLASCILIGSKAAYANTTAAPGSAPLTTKITVTPLKKGDTFQVLISASAITTLPVTGGDLPTGTTAYTSGSDLTGVDATTNKYVDVYEVDTSSKIVAFKEFNLTVGNIAAPVLETAPTVAMGTSAQSVKLALTPNNSEDTFKVQVVSKAAKIPGVEVAASGKAYTSGSDITGVDATKNKYVDIYEVDGSGKIVAFSEIIVTAGSITAPSPTAATAAPGSVPLTTKITVTPLKKEDTFQVLISASAITALPVTGGDLPTGTTAYTSGSDLTGVDATTNKYVDVYEVDGSSKIVAFKEFTLTAGNIAAPVLGTVPTVAMGTSAQSVKLALTPNNSEDTFKVQVVSKASKIPGVGIAASGKAYTSGSDITGVDATKNKYIDIYEVDGSGKIVAFSEIIVTAGSITAPSPTAATAAPGSVPLTTKITVTPLKKEDTFQVLISASTITALPVTGGDLPTGTTAYTSGSDLTGVDATTNKYVDVYEVDTSSKIVAFKEFTLTAGNIAAPVLGTVPTVAMGTSAQSVKLTLIPNNSEDTFKVQVTSKAGKIPGVGVAASGKAYTSGSDITGVDATKNKYIDIYEVDGSGKVAAFSEITVTGETITAPSPTSATAAPGSAPLTTKITVTPLKKGDTFQVLISASAITTLPVTGGDLPTGTTAYTSGSDLTGVDATTNKYVDVYEVDTSSKIVAFKEFTLTAGNIAAPVLGTAPTVAMGTSAQSVKLALTPNNSEDTFKVQVVSKAAKIPGVGVAASGKAYTSGSDITGVDATKNKYVDIYEVDGSGKIVAFSEIIVTAGSITAPSPTAATAAPGSVPLTTKITVTPLKKEDTFQVLISASAITALPVTGGDLPTGTTAYTSGSDLTGVDATTNKYVDVYEVDGSSKIVAFKEFTLTAGNIAAPVLGTVPTVAMGTSAQSVKLALTPNNSEDTFRIQVVSKASKIPGVGIAASGKAYTSGSDITGVDATKNKYIDIYEVDGSGKIVAFSEIIVTAEEITAPSL